MNNSIAWFSSALIVLVIAGVLTRLNPRYYFPTKAVSKSWALMFFLSGLQLLAFPKVSVSAWLYLTSFSCLVIISSFVPLLINTVLNSASSHKQLRVIRKGIYFQLIDLLILSSFIVMIINCTIKLLNFPGIGFARDVLYQISAGSQNEWIDRIHEFTIPIMWLSYIFFLFYFECFSINLKAMGWGNVFGILLLGVLSGGRTIIIRLILLLLITSWVRKSYGKKQFPWTWNTRAKLLSFSVLSILMFYFFYVWIWRAGGVGSTQISVSKFHYLANESNFLEMIGESAPRVLFTLFKYILLYLNTIADNFVSFYEYVSAGPYWGFYQLNNLASAFKELGIPTKSTLVIFHEVQEGFWSVGLHPAQWRTMAHKFIIDFGKQGSILGAAIFGLIIGMANMLLRLKSESWASLIIIIIGWGIWSAWESPLNSPQIVLVTYSVIFIILIRIIGQKKVIYECKEDII